MAMPSEPASDLPDVCPHRIDRPVMTQRWLDVAFAHWAVDPERVASLLPPGLEPDLHDGRAWVSLVGFEMDSLRVPGLPPIPTTSRFPEFNVRTYVRGPAGPGVWFCSLDVPYWLPTLVARSGFALPYCRGRVGVVRSGAIRSWGIERHWPQRAEGSMVVRITEHRAADPLAVFLTARWRLYATTVGGRLLTAPVHHEPWPLRRAELLDVGTGLATVAGLPVEGEPILHHADAVSVRVGRPRLLGGDRPARSPVPAPVIVHYDDDCGVCSASVRALRRITDEAVTFDPARRLEDAELRRLSQEAIVVTGEGGPWTGAPAVAEILRHAGPVGTVAASTLGWPGVRTVADLAYRAVARNRSRISQALGLQAECRLPE